MLNLAALLLADNASTASQSWSFTVSVTDDTELSTGIPVNLYGQDDVTMTVDWDDGSESTLTSDDYVALLDTEASIHTYSEAGEYTVTLSSDNWSDFYLEANSTTVQYSGGALYYFRQTLISIDTALPEVAGVRCELNALATSSAKYVGFYYMFCNCTSLVSLPSNLFVNNTAVTTFTSCFYGCSALASVPEGLFDNCTAVTAFALCFFGCSALASVPEDLFDSCADVTDLSYCFYDSFYFDGSIRIRAEGVTDATNFMTSSSAYDRYVYVPAGSTTADTFNALTISGMTVVEE